MSVDSVLHELIFPYDNKMYEKALLWVSERKRYIATTFLSSFMDVVQEPAITNWCAYMCIRMDMYRSGELETGRQRKEKRLLVRRVMRASEVNPDIQRVLDVLLLWIKAYKKY